MIVSIDWLKEFVDIIETPEELSDLLSSVGLEAEYNDQFIEIKGVIIGKVLSTDSHPNADRLKVCVVNDGENDFQVVCGAPNVKEGQTIAYAKVGSILPGGFKLKKIKLRGVESNGMICSAKELNISDEHDGILVLPESCVIGGDFFEEYGNKFLKIELDITPNRPDAFSHYGVARDISVFTNRALKPLVFESKNEKMKPSFKISVSDKNDCPRYIGAVVRNITIGPSPDWMQERLIAVGQRPINNLVDISNYILMEMGQPTHIFDWDKIDSKEILVRRANKKESIKTLDNGSFKLDQDQLLITDGKKPIAIAGVMGGFDSSVNDETKTIFIESAYFDPIMIRKSSKSLSLSTEASKRYERGADPEAAIKAFWKILELIEKHAGGSFDGDFIDLHSHSKSISSILVRLSEITQIIGMQIDKERIINILEGLGFSISITKDGDFECVPPSFRPDVEREIDIIEEIARINGYDNIPVDNNLYGKFIIEETDPQIYLQKFRDRLSGLGFYQHYSNSLQDSFTANLFSENSISMVNPLSKKMAYLRTSLYPSLIKAAELNIKNSCDSFKLYELANVHYKTGKKIEQMNEEIRLTGILVGSEQGDSIHTQKEEFNIFSVKGIIENLVGDKFYNRTSIIQYDNEIYDYGYQIYSNNELICSFGKLSKKMFKILKIDFIDIFGFDISIEKLNRPINNRYMPINTLPKISRRINLVMDQKDSIGTLLGLIKDKAGEDLIEYNPVEIFEDKKNLGENKKSIVFEMIFQNKEKTLEDKDVNPIIDEIIDIAQKKFNAKLRV
tara:strand:- start:821 stop:3193 length:2373 start_codon:yes stop_codon:yes gene_type:complete